MAWIACRIRQEIHAPVLFRQGRVGLGGRRFRIFKFRTLSGPKAVPSGFCKKLRATAMDELPQLINILRGEMSFVGPRPLIPEELTDLQKIPRGPDRLSVRPGLAGLAQLYGSKTPSLSQRLRWDLFYIDHGSLALDLRILFQSLAMTLRSSWDAPEPPHV